MKVQLRGTIRAALGTPELELEVPPSGVPLSRLLDAIAATHPRARAYLGPGSGHAVLRPVHNGTLVAAGDDPLVHPHDRLLLIHAVAGGCRDPRRLGVVDRRRVSTFLSARLFNPLVMAAVNAGLPVPGVAILETTGRRSGRPRRTPVGRCLDGDTFWLVAEHGHRAAYVRNIDADPRVRIKLGRRWRTGTAHPLPDDDPRARQRSMPAANAAVVRLMGSQLLTVRIDLDPERAR